MKQLCILLVRFYRKFLSPIKGGPCCRFYPTCSAYALEAFTKRGFFVGLYLTVWRILRCNPFCPGGYDPVPERGLRTNKGPSRKRDSRGSKEMRPQGRPHDAIPNLGREDTAPVRSRRRRPPNAPHRKDRNRTRRRKKAKR